MIECFDEKQKPQIHPIYICTLNVEGEPRHWYADSWYDFIKMWNDGDGPSGEDKLLDYCFYNFYISQNVSCYDDLRKICDSAFEKGILA